MKTFLKISFRLLATLLCLALLIVSLPQALLAQASEILGGYDPEPAAAEETGTNVFVLGERTDERTAHTKTFRLSDGSYVLADYAEPVHFEENGQWTDYDNTLKYIETESFSGYENTASDVQMRFSVCPEGGELVSLQSGEYAVHLSLLNASPNAKVAVTNTPAPPEGNDVDSAATLPNYSSSLVYEEIAKDTDLQYILSGGSLKENILIKERTDTCAFSFLLTLSGFVPFIEENGDIALNDTYSGETVFTIPAGFMTDADGEFSSDVSYSLEQTDENQYILSILPDPEWLNAEERKYPVTVDPSIYSGAYQTSDVSDSTAVQSDPNSTHGNDQFLRAGSTEPAKKNRTYIRLNTLPALPVASVIVDATLNLRQLKYQNNWKDYSGNVASMAFAAREVTSSWAENTLSWNSQPSVSSTVIDYCSVTAADPSATEGQLYAFHITSLFQKWTDSPGTNYGVCIYPVAEQAASADDHAFTCFYSSNNPYPENQTVPFFTVTYRNTAGLDDRYTYHSQMLGSSESSINDFTGNLTVVQDLGLKIDDFPFDLSYVFNNCFKSTLLTAGTGYGMHFGFGWHFSAVPIFNENLTGPYVNGAPVEYIDGDGTSHYFSYSPDDGCYTDEEALGYQLYIPAGGASLPRTLKTGDGWELEFTNGKLTNVSFYEEENSTPAYSFDYLYLGNRLTWIEKDSNTVLTLAYNSNNMLTSMTDAKGHTATITSSGSEVGTITTALGSYAYQYGTGDDLLRITETDTGKEIRYSYNSSHKVSLVSEYYDGNIGDSVGISYGSLQTVYRTRGADDSTSIPYDDILTTYQFDSRGQVTNVYSGFAYGQEIFSAFGVDYYGGTLFDYGENNIRAVYRSGYGTVNLLQNPSAESGTQYWTNINQIPENGADATVGNAWAGEKTFRVVFDGADHPFQGFEQAVTLTSGKTYTLSAYVKTLNVNGTGGALVGFRGGSANELQRSVLASSEYLKGTTATDLQNGWRRIAAQYTPAETGVYYAYVGAYRGGDGSVIYYDAVQLEEGSFLGGNSFSDYNYVRNAGFEDGASFWNNSLSVGGTSSTSRFGSYGQKIAGDSGSACRVYQYSEHIPAGQMFVLSGWAKADSVSLPESGSRTFELTAEIEYDDNTTEEEIFRAKFNPDIHVWQYATVSGAPGRTDTGYVVKISLCYDYNCNDAFFDNISLTLGGIVLSEEESSGDGGESGEGDGDGELIVINSTQKYQILDGLKYTYTYDNQGRIRETVIEDIDSNGSPDKFYTYTDYYTEAGAIDLEVTEETDERGFSTKYKYYNEKLYELVDGRNHTTSYTYNADDLLTKLSQTIGTLEISNNYVYNGNGDLTGITHKEGNTVTQSYSFTYDVYGNLTSILQGNTALVTYGYNPNNGKLVSATYANGFVEGYGYDFVNNLSELKQNGVVKYRCLYDRNNMLQYTVDVINGTTERYEYDGSGTLIRSVRYGTSTQTVQLISEYVQEYGEEENHSTCRYIDGNGNAVCSEVIYDAAHGRAESITLPGGSSIEYSYDVFGRSTATTLKTANETVLSNETYSYLGGSGRNGSTNPSTHLIGTITYSDNTELGYTYDGNGNILTVSRDGVLAYSYEYDELDQLTRETDVAESKVTLYEYDYSGNIQAKHAFAYWPGCPTSQYISLIGTSYCETVSYTYGNSTWKDQLTEYDGTPITYDASGNPLNWPGGISNMTWTGRELNSFVKGDYTYSFKYNSEGIRTEQTKWYTGTSFAEIYHYVLDGTKVVQEYTTTSMNSTPTNVKQYFYDASDSVIGFRCNGADYYFRKNLQGDVIAILNAGGTKVVEYTYSAWGEVLGVTGTLASTIGQINPFRYRGYYYDKDTELYYLQSRFFDPILERFLNTDSASVLLSKNLLVVVNPFEYCFNNPIDYTDIRGRWAERYDGFCWNDKGFDVNENLSFLSRQFCLLYSLDIVLQRGRWVWFEMKYAGMSTLRIAQEIWFHAIVYYFGSALKPISKAIGIGYSTILSLIKRARVINVNNDDDRCWVYSLIWSSANVVKLWIKTIYRCRFPFSLIRI